MVGVGMALRVVMDPPGVDQDERPRRDDVRTDRERLLQDPPGGHRDRRADAQHLLDEGAEVTLVPLVGGGRRARSHVRVVGKQGGSPRDRGGRRLVAGGDQGQEVVPQIIGGQRLAILVPGLDERREDVVALVEPGVRSGRVDLLVQQREQTIVMSPPGPGCEFQRRARPELGEVRPTDRRRQGGREGAASRTRGRRE